MGTGSFPGVKRPGRGVDHPPPCSAFMTSSRANFTFIDSMNVEMFTAEIIQTVLLPFHVCLT